MRNYSIILLISFLTIGRNAQAQDFVMPSNTVQSLEHQQNVLLEQRRTLFAFNFGVNIGLGWNNTSEFRFNASAGIFQAFGFKSVDHANFLASYMLQIEAFRGGVGSNLLDDRRARFEIDLRNILQVNAGWIANNPVKGRPLLRSVGASVSPIRDPFDYSIGLGTMFINGINHNRNQQMGVLSLGILEVAAAYANDGPFYHLIGLGDSHDRYWTGAGYLGAYFATDNVFVTSVSLQYLRFTGWQPNLYEMANMLDLDYMSYKNKGEQFFNQGVWNWQVGFRNNFAFNLKIYESNKTDVQDLIHIVNSYTFHPNPLKRRVTFGGTFFMSNYQTMQW